MTLCIVLFLVTYFINNDFDIRYIYNYLFLLSFIICSIFIDRRFYINFPTSIYFFLSLVVVIYSFLPSSVRDLESNNHAISIVVFFLCCLLAIPSKKEINYSFFLAIFAATLLSIYTVVIKICPEIYWGNIYPHLSNYTKEQATMLMIDYNYGVPVGGSANYTDYIIALALFICLGKIFSGYEKKKILLYFILCGLFLLGMIIQNRRSELFSTGIALLFMYLKSVDLSSIKPKRVINYLSVLLVLIFCFILLNSRGMLERYLSTLTGLFSMNKNRIEDVGNGRIVLWKEAIRKFLAAPVFGIGWNQFRAQNTLQNMEGINVHNDYLQWLCETGIVGFGLITTATVMLWIQASARYRNLKNELNSDNCEKKSYALISYGIQTFFIFEHLMDPCFYKLIFWPLFSFSIVLLNLSCRNAKQVQIRTSNSCQKIIC